MVRSMSSFEEGTRELSNLTARTINITALHALPDDLRQDGLQLCDDVIDVLLAEEDFLLGVGARPLLRLEELG